MAVNNQKINLFRKRLLHWSKNNYRDFPWRNTSEPYEVLIAEILLQRTRADNVVKIYNNFLQKYPDIGTLFNATEEEIADAIAPLGLRKRASVIKEISIDIKTKFKGSVPKNEKLLLEMKGIGNYITNTVLCFAFNQRKAIVDWNVARVISRVFDYKLKSSPHSDKDFILFVQRFVPKSDSKKFNWAILDFAAKVCKPIKPDCSRCNMSDFCNYFISGKKD